VYIVFIVFIKVLVLLYGVRFNRYFISLNLRINRIDKLITRDKPINNVHIVVLVIEDIIKTNYLYI